MFSKWPTRKKNGNKPTGTTLDKGERCMTLMPRPRACASQRGKASDGQTLLNAIRGIVAKGGLASHPNVKQPGQIESEEQMEGTK